MTAGVAVTDASPLIVFHQIGRLVLLRAVFPSIIAPPAVAREIRPSLGELPPWVVERQPPAIPQAAMALDAGEREAIALAIGLSADAVILDDRSARKCAAQLGVTVVGSVGLLLEARRRGYIAVVRPDLEAMVASGLFVSDALYRHILLLADETD